MKDFFDTWKFKILVGIAVFLAAIMAYAGANGRLTAAPQEILSVAVAPFQRAAAAVSNGVSSLWEKYTNIDAILEENEKLTTENAELRGQMVDYDKLKAENEAYKALTNIQEQHPEMSYVSSFVIGRDPLDFSANVSPLGLPEGVAKAITAALATADRYPDPLCRALREKLAVAEGVPAEWLLCGNGAADLIFRLALAAKPRTALVTAPTFAEYATALETAGCTVERHFLREENDFAVTKDLLNAVHPGTNMVFLCQPNNPTGQLAEPALVEALLRRCEAVGAVLAVDECFLDFLPEGEGLSAKHLLKNSKKLIILKAFTKLYGMAGVRLGYCLCSDTELLARMRAAGQPWAVSSLAQAAGIAALDETEYVAKVRALIEAQRPVLADGLRALGLRVIEGRANYLLFRAPEALGEALRRKGAVLRSCGNYPGLDASWYRTAVRTENENRQLLALLAETLPEVAQ